MAYKLIPLVAIVGLMTSLCFAQQNAPYHFSNCPAPATCCVVPVPQMTQPVPGGTPTVVNQSAVNLYGVHVSNINAANSYMQFFDSTTQPTLGTVPIGSSSWVIPNGQDRDLAIGPIFGMPFKNGIEACCSTTQGTFTAVGNCGFLMEWY